MGSWGVVPCEGGGPHENPRSLSSPRAWKLDFQKKSKDGGTDGQTDGPILSAGCMKKVTTFS